MIDKEKYKTVDEYISYITALILYYENNLDFKLLFRRVKKYNSKYINLKRKRYFELVKRNFHFDYSTNYIKLDSKKKNIIDFLMKIKDNSVIRDFDYFINKFKKINELGFKKIDDNLMYEYLVYIYSDVYDKESINFFFYKISLNQESFYDEIEKNILDIDMLDKNESITRYIVYNDVVEVLKELNHKRLLDLKQASIYLLILLLNIRVESFIVHLKSFKGDIIEELNSSLLEFNDLLDDKEYKIISLRYGFKNKKHTLEEVGNIFNLTRERIRQKEKQILDKIYKFAYENKNLINSYSLSMFNKFETKTVDSDIIHSKLNIYSNLFLMSLNALEMNNIIYDENRKIIFKGAKENLAIEEKRILRELPMAINKNNINKTIQSYKNVMRNYVNYIIDTYYNLNTDLYVKIGYNFNNLMLSIIDDLFPKGYKISSKDNLNKLKKYVKDIYGDTCELINKRKIETAFYNYDYRLIDRGTYINNKFLPEIDDDLLDEIIAYIDNEDINIYYDMIMKKYETELRGFGITNKYMLKGILDSELNNYFYTKRDYITKYPNVNGNQSIIDYINEAKGIFYFSDIMKKFDGVAEYVIYNVLYNYKEDSLIWLSNKRYIKKQDLAINQSTIDLLKNECEYLFDALNTEFISSKKIYGRLSLKNKDILKKIECIKNQKDLFAVMKVLLKDKYYFSRSYLSKSDKNINHNILVKKFAYKNDIIDKELIDDYLLKMNIRSLYSYLLFMEDFSDDYIQVNIDTIVKKELLDIDSDIIDNIKESLELIIGNIKQINTENFRGYYIFPKLDRDWNKYLLIGIIRTYLSEEYVVENTMNVYNKTEFLIRRIEDE